MGQLRIGAAHHHGFADSLDVWGHGVNLGTVDRSDKRRNILVPGEFAEREHTSRVGRLVIFDDELKAGRARRPFCSPLLQRALRPDFGRDRIQQGVQ